MSIESLLKEFKSGMTFEQLLDRHQSELKEAKRNRLNKSQMVVVERYHRQDIINWRGFEKTAAMMAAFEYLE